MSARALLPLPHIATTEAADLFSAALRQALMAPAGLAANAYRLPLGPTRCSAGIAGAVVELRHLRYYMPADPRMPAAGGEYTFQVFDSIETDGLRLTYAFARDYADLLLSHLRQPTTCYHGLCPWALNVS
jgi:hypothetical protein